MHHVRRFMLIFGIVWLGIALMPCHVSAHGLPQQPALANTTSPPTASTIAHELQEHCRYLFTEDQLVRLDQVIA